MKASDIRNLVIVAIICAGGVAYGAIRYLHHRQWSAAHSAAQHAFAQAWVHRDDPEAFEPLRRRAEVEGVWARSVEAWGKTDSIHAIELDTCIGELGTYRVESRLVAMRRDEGVAADAEWKNWSHTAEDLRSCLPAGVY